ncbi:hypothetical protein OKW50_007970 [Paraburkholderia youngii]|uniref:hypothetical protein n=1 Tax=Paraburkholderia youngii TaxID=2782701 RepID=UPI003D262297
MVIQRYLWVVETPLDWPRHLPVIVTFYGPLHPGFHAKGINWLQMAGAFSRALTRLRAYGKIDLKQDVREKRWQIYLLASFSGVPGYSAFIKVRVPYKPLLKVRFRT